MKVIEHSNALKLEYSLAKDKILQMSCKCVGALTIRMHCWMHFFLIATVTKEQEIYSS